MKIGNTRLSRRTLALITAAVLLFGGGSYGVTKAALTYFSNDYTAEFELDHIHVHLLENGNDVCHGENKYSTVHRSDSKTDAGERKAKYKGNLLEEYFGYTNPDHYSSDPAYTLGTPGTVEPGRSYPEKIQVRNGSGEENKSQVPQYVRLVVKKYWVKTVKTGDKETKAKDTELSPELIKLSYEKETYNTSNWILNESENEESAETQTYYYNKVLEGGQTTEPLFDTLMIDNSVAAAYTEHVAEEQQGNKTIYTYTYDYDGYTFYIEADVQAIQTHNVNDAISSLWGVSNVSAKNGVVTVK